MLNQVIQIDSRLYSEEVRENAEGLMRRIYAPYTTPDHKLPRLEEFMLEEGFATIGNVMLSPDGKTLLHPKILSRTMEELLRDYGALNWRSNLEGQPLFLYGDDATNEPNKNFRLMQHAYDGRHDLVEQPSFAIYVRFKLPEDLASFNVARGIETQKPLNV